MHPASLELHHEPACLADVEVPRRIRVPGLALRVRVPGHKLQHRLAAGALALGLVVTASATAGLLSASHGRYVADAVSPVTPAPQGRCAAAVIGGHVDSHIGPGVFFRLHLLRPGDRVYVRQADSRLGVFRVTSVRQYAKSRFPTSEVYGPVPAPELRLITCGGAFDPAYGSYLSNVVVYATLIA